MEQEDEQPSARALNVDQTLVEPMLEHATDGTVLVTRDGTILATTPAIERMIGLSPASLVGTKIDKSFTSEIGADGANVTIVAGIIGLAHGLGLEVIAEGIETRRQLTVLQDLGCTLGQGYLFSAPVAIDDLLAIDFERIHVGRVEPGPR